MRYFIIFLCGSGLYTLSAHADLTAQERDAAYKLCIEVKKNSPECDIFLPKVETLNLPGHVWGEGSILYATNKLLDDYSSILAQFPEDSCPNPTTIENASKVEDAFNREAPPERRRDKLKAKWTKFKDKCKFWK